MFNTNEFFESGKLSTILDASAGSSGKGVIGSFVTEHADNWQFCVNTFYPQAGHWVKLDDGREFFYQTFNSCAYQDKYEKMYLSPGCIVELPALWKEMEENNIDPKRIGIHPLVAILQDKDAAFERGEVDLEGNPMRSDGTMKHGSTCHGVGAAKTRRVLRRQDAILAKDVPELKEFLCDTSEEIIDRLNSGQSGLMEVAQGFQLSLLGQFYPYCTSRNCTVGAGFDDSMLPLKYAGNVLLNMRTYPIRISNYKYIDEEGNHLTWDEVQQYDKEGKNYEKYEGSSGPGYEDQEEISWEELTDKSGSDELIMEITSVTKLPRRVFTFSQQNLRQAIRYNDTGNKMFLSVNFANYVDSELGGVRGGWDLITKKMDEWLDQNGLFEICDETGAVLRYIGTGPLTDDKIIL